MSKLPGDRLPCCVPWCRRTTLKGDLGEWICAAHWRLTDELGRKVYRRLYNLAPEFYEARVRIWLRLKRQAIERSGGI